MRRFCRVAVAGVLALGLSGCYWSMPSFGPDRASYNDAETGVTPASVGNLEQLWSTGDTQSLLSPPVVSQGGVHVTTAQGCAVATMDPATGDTVGASSLYGPQGNCAGGPTGAPGRTEVSPPFVVDGKVLVGFEMAENHRPGPPVPLWNYTASTQEYDLTTSERTGTTGGRIDSVRGDVTVRQSGSLHCVIFQGIPICDGTVDHSAGVGDRAWNVGKGLTIAGKTTLGTDDVFLSGHGLLTTTPGSDTYGQGVRAYAVATATNGCGAAGDVECPLWATPTDGNTAGPVVIGDDGATVYVGTSNGTVYALDAATGAVTWSTPVGAPVRSQPALAQGHLFVPTANGLVALDAATGGIDWYGSLGADMPTQPAVTGGGVVFTLASNGTVSAFDAAGCGPEATCPALWSDSVGTGNAAGFLAVDHGRVFAVWGNTLAAFGTPPAG